jgi:excisionase family DNA binding protein
MASDIVERTTVTIPAADIPAARRVAEALQHTGTDDGVRSATLVTAEGQTLELAGFLVDALQVLVALLAQGDDVALVPVRRDLSLDEAAILLGVSSVTLRELLDGNELPSTGTGAERRVQLDNLVAYKKQQSARNRAYLAEALAVAQEAGAYD